MLARNVDVILFATHIDCVVLGNIIEPHTNNIFETETETETLGTIYFRVSIAVVFEITFYYYEWQDFPG